MSDRNPFIDRHLIGETATPKDQNMELNQRACEEAEKMSHPDEDVKSVSSNLRRLGLQPGKTAHKRAAAELAQGLSHEEGGRPNKLRSSYELPNQRLSPSADHPGGGLIPRVRPSSTQSFLDNNPPLAHPESEDFASPSPPPSPAFDGQKETTLLLQPETRPITQEQLVNEVKGIYAGLVMVEKKCVQVDQQLSATKDKLSNEQWQALIALHRTLLHEHHDFFLASQHPSSSLALRRLATKYAMPARMWRHGIHSFLELLRGRLPDSLDHMVAFVYLAYSMMALLMESVPSFEETWIECLGDLARYRMAIEEADLRDREIWSNVARMWYNKAADKSPNVGRIQHHLAVLARPNIVQQLFYYSKALVSVIPFPNTQESIMLLFNPFLEDDEIASQRYPLVESTLVKAHGILFKHGSIPQYTLLMDQFCSILDSHIGRVTSKFRGQGPEIASSLCAATFDFGNEKAFLTKCFPNRGDLVQRLKAGEENPWNEDIMVKRESMHDYWTSLKDTSSAITVNLHYTQDSDTGDAKFSDSNNATAYACQYLGETITVLATRIGDKNVVPCMHLILAYLFSLAFAPNALIYIEGCIPWEGITIFLNTLGRSGVIDAHFEDTDFPQSSSGTGRQLPEDFIMRGLIWALYYFPINFFDSQLVEQDERSLELPSHAAPRAERCLWLGVQLASLDRWIRYNKQTKQFSVTNFGRSLEKIPPQELESRSRTLSAEPDPDSKIIDVEDKH